MKPVSEAQLKATLPWRAKVQWKERQRGKRYSGSNTRDETDEEGEEN
jgi:hypothetical protein